MNKINSFLKLHWRGKLPLWVSYWVVGYLVGVVGAIVIGLLFALSLGWLPSIVGKALYGTLLTALLTFVYVGIWRAGTVYSETSPYSFGVLAKAGVVLGALLALANMVTMVRNPF